MLALLLSLLLVSAQAQVAGVVTDADGRPIPLVNVGIVGGTDGDVTDGRGRFVFTTSATGAQVVQATIVGYESASQRITLAGGDSVFVELTLRERIVEMEAAVVQAGPYVTGTDVLGPLEAVTTPGASGDLLRAFQFFPGVTSVNEEAGLFVRGGDWGETAILIDGIRLNHPYRYESPSGGFFGAVPPFMVRGTSFATGAFPVKHGQALSAIVDMESLNEPATPEASVTGGLAGSSIQAGVPLLDGRLGVRVSGNQSATGTLFRINGESDTYVQTPGGRDGSVQMQYRYSDQGRIKAMIYSSTNDIGVREEEPSFQAIYRAGETQTMRMVSLRDLRAGWQVDAALGWLSFDSDLEYGGLAIDSRDDDWQARVDVERSVRDGLLIGAGVRAERVSGRVQGQVPDETGTFDPSAPNIVFSDRFDQTVLGTYVQADARLAKRVRLETGIRADAHDGPSPATADIRASLTLDLSPWTALRLAAGTYHQYPGANEYEGFYASNLVSARGRQASAGLFYERGLTTARAEVYLKRSDDLAVLTSAGNEERYESLGTAEAMGLDLYVKYGAFLRTRWSGWLSYSYLNANRTQSLQNAGSLRLANGPTNFQVPHQASAVVKWRAWRFLSLGASVQTALGRPITPVVGAVPASDGDYFLPIDGAPGSDTLPTYRRMDLSVSWFQPFEAGHSIVYYAAFSNATGRDNVMRY
ncbi:MAG: TonB-dependent receptor, partial [Bacteroidota bacterium]